MFYVETAMVHGNSAIIKILKSDNHKKNYI